MTGVTYNCPEADYNAIEAVRKSDLDLIAKSPAHYHEARLIDRPPEDTKAMLFGRLFHTFVLEPDEVGNRFFVLPEGLDRRTKAGKEEYKAIMEEHGDKDIVSSEDMDIATRMGAEVRENRIFKRLIKGAVIESAFTSADEDTGLIRKAKPDIFNPKDSVIADLKSTASATVHDFSSSSFKFRYHVQDAYYSDIVSDVTHNPINAFVFIAVEKTPPYSVAIYCLDSMAVELGHQQWKRDIKRLKMCMDTDMWPGYEPYIQPLSLPRYAYQ